MANEITLNPYEQVEGEFTAEELESLQVGEQLAEAENELLAGKYRSAEELERGYLELQKRLSGKEEPQEEVSEPDQVEEEPQEEEPTGDLYEAIREAYEKGDWDPQLVEHIENLNPIDVMNLFLENNSQKEEYIATQEDIDQVQASVGGPEQYREMISWAGNNLKPEEIQLYDAAMDKGDPLTIFFAAQALYARYQDSVGYDGELLTGGAPQATQQGFRSQAELVAAMSDPRYDKDPAYRQDIADKLAISNI